MSTVAVGRAIHRGWQRMGSGTPKESVGRHPDDCVIPHHHGIENITPTRVLAALDNLERLLLLSPYPRGNTVHNQCLENNLHYCFDIGSGDITLSSSSLHSILLAAIIERNCRRQCNNKNANNVVG